MAKRKPHSVLEINTNLWLFLTPFQRGSAKTARPICTQPNKLCQMPASGKGSDAAEQLQGAHCPLGHFPLSNWAGSYPAGSHWGVSWGRTALQQVVQPPVLPNPSRAHSHHPAAGQWVRAQGSCSPGSEHSHCCASQAADQWQGETDACPASPSLAGKCSWDAAGRQGADVWERGAPHWVTHSRDSMPASTQRLGLEGGFLGESPCCKLSSKQAEQTQILWRGSTFKQHYLCVCAVQTNSPAASCIAAWLLDYMGKGPGAKRLGQHYTPLVS